MPTPKIPDKTNENQQLINRIPGHLGRPVSDWQIKMHIFIVTVDSLLRHYPFYMFQYSFTTQWQFNAPLETIWNEIYAMDEWPEWWKYVKKVELLRAGEKIDIGSIRRITWRTALPYSLTFNSELVSMEYHKRIEGRAFGELEGRGIWTFDSRNGQTLVRYDWMVNTTLNWMKFLAPIARPLFSWNHDKVMLAGYEGLLKKVSANL